MVPIVTWEFGYVAPWMPIVFSEQAGGLAPMAMMSPVPGRNLFVSPEGQWVGGYIPAIFRTYPFREAHLEGRKEGVVCFDEDSGLLAEEDAGDFFAENGEPSAALRGILDLLQAMSAAQSETELAMASIAAAGITEQWPLRVRTGELESATYCLHRINEAALSALDDAAFLNLRSTGGLVLAYLQLVSMAQTSRFDLLFPTATAAWDLRRRGSQVDRQPRRIIWLIERPHNPVQLTRYEATLQVMSTARDHGWTGVHVSDPV